LSIADLIPQMDDKALISLRVNALRLGAGSESPRQKEAESLIPLIDAEVALRKAAKPKATPAPRKKAVSKKKAVVEKDEAEDAEPEEAELS
jgi:hypothetical protein